MSWCRGISSELKAEFEKDRGQIDLKSDLDFVERKQQITRFGLEAVRDLGSAYSDSSSLVGRVVTIV